VGFNSTLFAPDNIPETVRATHYPITRVADRALGITTIGLTFQQHIEIKGSERQPLSEIVILSLK
jgi:hypothetical protein